MSPECKECYLKGEIMKLGTTYFGIRTSLSLSSINNEDVKGDRLAPTELYLETLCERCDRKEREQKMEREKKKIFKCFEFW